MRNALFLRLSLLASILALCVVVLGAYVRLSDAGLGCPDWPGCYGHIDVPQSTSEVERANMEYPDRPVEAQKAWKEMIHRYFAGTLGLLVFTMAFLAFRNRHQSGQQFGVPVFLLGLIVFQALLGMWTVTIKLNPTIVMSHLMGGMATLSLLWWVTLRQSRWFESGTDIYVLMKLRTPALIGLALVILQIMLGGWTSANYASLHCSETVLTCQGQVLPAMDFKEAFTLWRGTELNFEGGVLDNDARVTIHFMHRIVALVTFLYVGWLALSILLKREYRSVHSVALMILTMLLVQISLGISNVIFVLPLPVAVAHNAGAAILLLTMVTLTHVLRPGGKYGLT